ncbi:phosphoenolpyruvate--protein phosphotransferase [Rickettsiales bacterium LUAb2]
MFELFKLGNKSKSKDFDIKIYAPIDGKVIALEDVDDAVFSQKTVGDGIAIDPTSNVVVAPFNGIIKLVHGSKHAVIIQGEQGIEVLVHIGIDTIELKGEGFKVLTKIEQKVKKGDPLIEFDLEFVRKHAKSVHTIVVAVNLENNFVNKTAISEVKSANDVIYSVSNKKNELITASKSGANSSDNIFIEQVKVLNAHGLHARPASFLVTMVKKFKSNITIIKGDNKANAKSLIELLALSINYNDEVKISASGEDAKIAIKEIINAFASGLGEDIETVVTTAKTNKIFNSGNVFKDINNKDIPTIATGTIIYPGITIGTTVLLEEENINVQENSNLTETQEQNRLNKAINEVKQRLEKNIKVARDKKLNSQVDIFLAHLEVLNDDFLLNEVSSCLGRKKTAEFAWKMASEKTCAVLNATKNQLLQERIADIKDIERGILYALMGKELAQLIFPENSIVIAKDLVPSDLARFDQNVKGVILALGSSTSHVSIMMKNVGLPALASLGTELLSINNGVNVILNAKNGQAIFNPNINEVEKFNNQIKILEEKSTQNLIEAKKPAITKDGLQIKVMGNVGNLEEAIKAYEKGAEGIGLLRSEFLFYNNKTAPSEEEQYQAYQQICNVMQGSTVIARTLDVGGDKPIAYINIPEEENPIVGLRGVRNYAYNKEIFLNQIRALLRIKPAGVCKIMIPMVSLVDEVLEIKEIIAEERAKLNITADIKIGTMIEVPAAALMAEQFSKHLDFLSIGTNDLAQYTLAMDRGHAILTKNIDNLNPAVLRMIELTTKGAAKYNIPVGVCGAMASEAESVPLLLGLGVVDLSVTRDLIPDIKALIRNLDYKKCKDVAEKAINMDSPAEVKALVKKEFGDLL